MKRNRISAKDTIKAHGFNKGNRLVAQVYDSGFTTVESVIDKLCERSSGFLSKVMRVEIVNKTKDTSAWYARQGDRFVKEA